RVRPGWRRRGRAFPRTGRRRHCAAPFPVHEVSAARPRKCASPLLVGTGGNRRAPLSASRCGAGVEEPRMGRYMRLVMTKPFQIRLPDGSVREVAPGTTPADVAAAIGPGLAKAALAARVDGEVRDIMRPFEGDAELALSTS